MIIMKLPNGYGGVIKLSGNRRKPYAARITVGWTTDANGKPIFTAEKVMKEVGMLNKVHEELVDLENRVKKELAEKSTLRAGAREDFDPGDF